MRAATADSHAPRATSLRDESGQSLILITLAMVAILALAAIAIDVAGWYQQRHQAQVAADAAALAAANYMGNGGSAGTGTNTATSIASTNMNGASIASSNVTIDTTNKTVTVTVPTTGSIVFAGIGGLSGPAISARAVASWLVQDCTTASNGCAFIYGADNICTNDTGVTGQLRVHAGTINHGVTITDAGTGNMGGTRITGAVISSSNITLDVHGGPTYGTAAYSNGSGCTISGTPSASVASPNPFTAIYNESVPSLYPVDYSKVYSACGTTSTSSTIGNVTCTGPNSYPSWCTQSNSLTGSLAVATPITNAVYCNAGTGTKSTPSTWNGAINVTGSGTASYIGGIVNFSVPTGSTMAPASGNNLIAYGAECNPASSSPPATYCSSSTATTSPAIDVTSNGNATISGDMFAPGGVIDSHLGGSPSLTGFLEGWDVVYNVNGTVTGQGPPVNSTDQFVSDQLTQ